MELTREEQQQIQSILNNAHQRERETASSSKNGFLGWLRGTTLGYIVGKLIDWTWTAIKTFFFGY